MAAKSARQPESIPALIETITPGRLSLALDVKVQAISNMKGRAAIPARHWPALIQAAAAIEIRITFEDLVRLHAQPTTSSEKMAAQA
jgi:hypothetical protein